ncbi:MAG TPA: KH domain-containing protein [Desulfobacteraceae bacterium]|nr:KH domain-containing protein [Desulfobacteraceae bacterium]
METFEFEGKNTEEAVDNACRKLNVPRDDISIEVIEPGSPGIFGLVGGKKAKVRISIARQEPAAESGEDDTLSIARRTLEDILSLIPMEDAEVNTEVVDGAVKLSIEGDKSGLLIGRKGRTLDALQFIVTKIVSKALDRKVQVVIDSEDYRRRRKDYLTQMAVDMGEKARKTKKPMTTGLLNPHDRRIVHIALKDQQQITTTSRGEGMLKKVVIIPNR